MELKVEKFGNPDLATSNLVYLNPVDFEKASMNPSGEPHKYLLVNDFVWKMEYAHVARCRVTTTDATL